MGVSPGGGLVIFSSLFLGVEQHVAQGISLITQIPPTSLSGIRRYLARGFRVPIPWLALLSLGMLAGGVLGARAAGGVSDATLRWVYVAYLLVLCALLILKSPHASSDDDASPVARHPPGLAFVLVGLFAGFSSGFLGIGGGLAITVGLVAGLKLPQHQAQLVSLVLSVIPTTLPSGYLYWRAGWSASLPVLAAVIIGLWLGTDLGARCANRANPQVLRRSVIGFVLAMAAYMVFKALGSA
jgi:uncharacterized membrane protein YfcA